MLATTFDSFDASPSRAPARASRAGAALVASVAIHALLLASVPDWRHRKADPPPPMSVFLLAAAQPEPAQAAAATPPAEQPRAEPAPRPAAAAIAEVANTTAHPPPRKPRPASQPTKPTPIRELPPPRVERAAMDRPAVAPPPPTEQPPAAEPVQTARSSAPVPAATVAATSVASPDPPPRPDPAALLRYRDTLSQRFAQVQTYPRLARMRGWEGEVTLVLTIARKGGLLAVRISHSSGHEILDQHALSLVENGEPLPAPPETDAPLEITVPVLYRLRSS